MRSKADVAVTESWQRLTNRGFLMQAVGQSAGAMTLTSKGLQAADAVNFEEIIVRQKLDEGNAARGSSGSVYDNFAAGHYDTAVLDAFKLVEDAVRNAATGLPAGLVGGPLVRQAFDKQKGPLRDPKSSPRRAGRDAGSLRRRHGCVQKPGGASKGWQERPGARHGGTHDRQPAIEIRQTLSVKIGIVQERAAVEEALAHIADRPFRLCPSSSPDKARQARKSQCAAKRTNSAFITSAPLLKRSSPTTTARI